MDDKQRRKLETVSRLDDFGQAHAADFAANSVGKQLFTEISNIATRLAGFASSQTTGRALALYGTSTRAAGREDLRVSLEAICRTARAQASEMPGIEDNFRLPSNANDQELLAVARSIAENAVPISAQLIALELPTTFLEDLNEDIEALEAAISAQTIGRGKSAAARAEINDALDSANIIRRKLDAVVKNKYANNPGVLAEWVSASHTVRDPRRRQSAETPAPGVGGPASTNPA